MDKKARDNNFKAFRLGTLFGQGGLIAIAKEPDPPKNASEMLTVTASCAIINAKMLAPQMSSEVFGDLMRQHHEIVTRLWELHPELQDIVRDFNLQQAGLLDEDTDSTGKDEKTD